MKNQYLSAAASAVALMLSGASVASAQTTMSTGMTGSMSDTAMPMTTTSMSDNSMTGSMTSSGSMSMSSTMSALESSSDLSYGSTGDNVSALQTFLVAGGFLTIPSGVSMGYFGPLTQAALASYQSSVGLPAHGYFGPLTRAELETSGSMSMSSGTTGSMTTTTTTSGGVMVGGALMTPDKNIVQNAVNANNVTTVVAAVQAAGLVPTLEGTGPFTVFAPDNNAFAKLGTTTVSNLLLPQNLAQLKDILTYHVVAGRYTSADLYDGEKLTTVEGKQITIGKSSSGQLTINGTAMVETPDVISSNGVTFVIDTVLTPPVGVEVGGALMTPDLNIVQNALNASNVTTLVAAVKAANLVTTLEGTGPFTVFAPDNNAFAKLPAGTVANLLLPQNLSQLTNILTYHVVAGRYTSADLTNGQVLTTVEGKTLTIGKSSTGQITVNGTAMVETPDVISSNGVTFVIDTVLTPPAN